MAFKEPAFFGMPDYTILGGVCTNRVFCFGRFQLDRIISGLQDTLTNTIKGKADQEESRLTGN